MKEQTIIREVCWRDNKECQWYSDKSLVCKKCKEEGRVNAD